MKDLTKIQENEIINLYNSGLSSLKVSKIINYSKRTVLNVLKRNNIKARKNIRNKKYYFNENYFEDINSSDKAYFLGLLTADGNVSKAVNISLQKPDEYILEIFKQKINFLGHLYTIKDNRKESYQDKKVLALYSFKMKQDLLKYGVIPNKSKYTYFPNIPEEFHSHFIRGVFDGDGCICISKKPFKIKFSITGNILLIEKIQEILMQKCNLNKTKLYNDKKHPPEIVTMQNTIARNFHLMYNYLYKDCENLFLIRKKEKFEKWNSFV